MTKQLCNSAGGRQYKSIRVLVADSSLMGNQLLAAALKQKDHHFFVVGTAETCEQALAAVHDGVDVVIVSATVGGSPCSGFRLTRRIVEAHPEVRVVTLLDQPERGPVVESFRAGASGVLCRAEPLEVLRNCIQSVYEGQVWANNDELRFVLEALVSSTLPSMNGTGKGYSLSPREQKIVTLVADGLTNPQIATELRLSEHTVKNYLLRMFEKLGVSSRIEMVFTALGRPHPPQSSSIIPEECAEAPQDEHALLEWYAKAAEYVFPFAQFKLGQMYLDGRGTTQDLASAYMWLSLSEETGERLIQLSKAYRHSLKSKMTPADLVQARQRASHWLTQHQHELKHLMERPVVKAHNGLVYANRKPNALEAA
jgi:two-component system, NarL family, nitrate/nitrite response regulator NarL